MDNSNLYSEDDEFAVPETQESPATFSKNIIRRLGIRRTSSGTDAADPNSNTNLTNFNIWLTKIHFGQPNLLYIFNGQQ